MLAELVHVLKHSGRTTVPLALGDLLLEVLLVEPGVGGGAGDVAGRVSRDVGQTIKGMGSGRASGSASGTTADDVVEPASSFCRFDGRVVVSS